MKDTESQIMRRGWARVFADQAGFYRRGEHLLKDEGPRGYSLWTETAGGTDELYRGDFAELEEVDEFTGRRGE